MARAQRYPRNVKVQRHVAVALVAEQEAIAAYQIKDYPTATQHYKRVYKNADMGLLDVLGLKNGNGKAAAAAALIPERYALSQNYPNPFNPSTTIAFELPEANKVTLRIYNVKGQLVRTLLNNGARDAGQHTVKWDGLNQGGHRVASGFYIYRIDAGNFSSARKMILLN